MEFIDSSFSTGQAMVEIEYLADCQRAVPLLAKWHHAEWKDVLPGWTLERAVAELQTHTGHRQVPTTLVALEEDCVVGSASLLVADLEGWEHLSPWLASVYVVLERRGEGIGRRLITGVVKEAAALGIPELFLWTAGQRAFYERLGWEEFATVHHGTVDITVMRRAVLGDASQKTR